MSFDLKLEDKTEYFYVKLSGDLDIDSSTDLKNQLLDTYKEDKKGFLIDMEDLSYIDSMGIGALISVYNEVNEDGFQIKIINAQENIVKLFKITDLIDVFNMR